MEIPKEKKRRLALQTSVLRFFKSFAWIHASLPLLDNGVDGPDDRPAVGKEDVCLDNF